MKSTTVKSTEIPATTTDIEEFTTSTRNPTVTSIDKESTTTSNINHTTTSPPKGPTAATTTRRPEITSPVEQYSTSATTGRDKTTSTSEEPTTTKTKPTEVSTTTQSTTIPITREPTNSAISEDTSTTSTEKTITSSTTEKITITTMRIPFTITTMATTAGKLQKCNKEGELFPVPGYCEQFIICICGYLHKMKCNGDNHFNPTTGRCEKPSIANCNVSEETIIPSEAAESTTTEEGTSATSTRYPEGTTAMKFTTVKSTEIPATSTDIEEFTTSTRKATTTSINKESTTISSDINTTRASPTAVTATKTDKTMTTSEEYTSTTKTMPTEMRATTTIHTTRWPTTSPTKIATTTMETSVTAMPTSDIIISECKEPTYLRQVPCSCEHFIICLFGYEYKLKCRGGQHFSNVTRSCEEPSAAKCVISEACLTTTKESTFTTETSPDKKTSTSGKLTRPLCNKPNGLYPIPGDCGSFIECKDGYQYKRKCLGRLHFNPVTNTCQHPCRAKCKAMLDCPTSKATTEGTTTRRTSIPRPSCTKPNGSFHVPGKCEFFIQCINGIGYQARCEEGFLFDFISKKCMPASLAKCGPSLETTTSSTTVESTTKHY